MRKNQPLKTQLNVYNQFFTNASLIAFLIIGALISSCSVQKRIYRPGYHVEWANANKNINNKNQSMSKKESQQSNELKFAILTQKDDIKESGIIANPIEKINHNEAPIDKSITALVNNIKSTSFFKKKKDENKSEIIRTNQISHENYRSKNNPDNKIKATLTDGGEPKTNGLAIAGFILGVVGLLLSFIGLGIISSILGLIFSAIGLGKINRDPSKWKGKGLAIAGLITSVVAILLWVLLILIIAVAIAA